MNEIWKDIEGFEGFYQVSNHGRIKSLDRLIAAPNGFRLSKGRMLKYIKGGIGYRHVSLCQFGKLKKIAVHRLVALSFIPNPDNKREVNHKNGNKLDNTWDNLEWCTRKENARHAVDIGLRAIGEKSYNTKLTNENVRIIKQRLINGERQVDICKTYGVTNKVINNIKCGKTWMHIR